MTHSTAFDGVPESWVFDSGALFLAHSETLILSDMHLGQMKQHPEHAYPVPTPAYEDVETKLVELIERYEPTTVIFNGDVFHGFPVEDAAIDVLVTADAALPPRGTLLLTLGNHEDAVGGYPMAVRHRFDIVRSWVVNDPDGDVLVCHGHEERYTYTYGDYDFLVVGHVHACMERPDGSFTPAYWWGANALDGASVCALPAFGQDDCGLTLERAAASTQWAPGGSPLLRTDTPLSEYVATPVARLTTDDPSH
jgi:metallophosphoesterase superfamily enzyme